MIVANLATYPARRHMLMYTIFDMLPQVDRINVVLNQYSAVPEEFANLEKVVPLIPSFDMKDVGKFYPTVSPEDIVLLIDDDIRYPEDYVTKTVGFYENLPIKEVVAGYHASSYTRPSLQHFIKNPLDLFRWKSRLSDFRRSYWFLSAQLDSVVVDQIGTGTAIMYGKFLPPFEYMLGSQKFVDVRFARWCFENKFLQVCLPREAGWLGQQDAEESIYEKFTKLNNHDANREIKSFAFKNSQIGRCFR